MIKRWTVVIDFERRNPKTKSKESTQRSWTFIEAKTGKEAIKKCTTQLEANEAGNSPRITRSEALLIKGA